MYLMSTTVNFLSAQLADDAELPQPALLCFADTNNTTTLASISLVNITIPSNESGGLKGPPDFS